MFFIKKTIFLFLILSVIGCMSNNQAKVNPIKQNTITIDTPTDRYNIILK